MTECLTRWVLLGKTIFLRMAKRINQVRSPTLCLVTGHRGFAIGFRDGGGGAKLPEAFFLPPIVATSTTIVGLFFDAIESCV